MKFGEQLVFRGFGQLAEGFADAYRLPLAAHFVVDRLAGYAEHPGNFVFRDASFKELDFSVDLVLFHGCFVNPVCVMERSEGVMSWVEGACPEVGSSRE